MKASALEWGGKRFRKWAADIARCINANKPVPGIGTSTTETEGGIATNATPKAAPSGGGGGTQSMYFIDGGVLKTGDFSVANVANV